VPESPVRIALIGFGHVGRALARLLAAKREPLERLDLARLLAGGPGAASGGTVVAPPGSEGVGPDTTAYDRRADLTTALRDHGAEGGAADGSRLR
jgi:hypothetical protein